MRIIPRSEWNARPPKNRTTTSPGNRVYYVVHHSGASVTQTVRAIQDWCMDGRGFSDIDYNHLVRGSTGEIYEGRGWDVVGAHTTNFNTSGVGVCIIGNDQASDAAKASVRWLYEQYNQRCGRTLKIRGHRELATTGTDCPGDHVFAWVHAGMPAPAEEDDMPTADEIADALITKLSTDEGRQAVALGLHTGMSQAATAAVSATNTQMGRQLRDYFRAVVGGPTEDDIAEAKTAILAEIDKPEA